MLSSLQQEVVRSMFMALKPIARLMLRSGISYRQFDEIGRQAFVDVASEDFGLRGRMTNVSRVAAMTGLSRKEVKRLRDQTSSFSRFSAETRSLPADLLHIWHTDEQYIDDAGIPRRLPLLGAEPSFQALVRKVGGDIPHGAMLAELKRFGVVDEQDGTLVATSRHFVPPELDEGLPDALIYGLRNLSATLFNNVSGGPLRFIRAAYSNRIPSEKVSIVRGDMAEKLKLYIEQIDDELGSHEPGLEDRDDLAHVSVGIYYFEDEKKPAE